MRVLLFASLLLLSESGVQAELPAERAAKWEYAELSFRTIPARPERTDPEGKKVDAVPESVSIRWTTRAEEVSLKSWAELADRSKVKLKDGSAGFQRIQALDALGAEGWELVDYSPAVTLVARGPESRGKGLPDRGGTTSITATQHESTMLFKRRAK